jgi:hypothetical protein
MELARFRANARCIIAPRGELDGGTSALRSASINSNYLKYKEGRRNSREISRANE